MRILITGSRDVTDPTVVRAALWEATVGHRGPHTLVHGAARGVDTLALIAAKRFGWEVEPHPAAWSAPCRPECRPGCRKRRGDGSEYCSAAGHYRNQVMVDLGADVVVAVFKAGAANRGTSDCVRRAEAVGLTVKRVTA